LKKRSKKLLFPLMLMLQQMNSMNKSFLVLFFKKELPFFVCPVSNQQGTKTQTRGILSASWLNLLLGARPNWIVTLSSTKKNFDPRQSHYPRLARLPPPP
jgi:hypothetical protein